MFKPAPTEYPIPYSFAREFMSLPRTGVLPPAIGEVESRITSKSPILKSVLLSALQGVRPDLVGILHGEYVVTADGLLLLNRSGHWFSVNTPLDNQILGAKSISTRSTRAAPESCARNTLKMWDSLPLAENTLLMCSIWSNYYHFTFDMIPKLRLAEQLNYSSVYIPQDLLKQRYQQSLFARAVRPIPVATSGMMRLRNPIPRSARSRAIRFFGFAGK